MIKFCNACNLIANMHAVELSFKRCMHWQMYRAPASGDLLGVKMVYGIGSCLI